MASFKKTNSKIFLKSNAELLPDNQYWKNYSVSVLLKEFGPIDFIDFSPKEPHCFAVTCSCRVQIYNPVTKLLSKNLNKFRENAYGGSYRKDGELICVGGDESVVKIFNVHTRNPLRIFAGHSKAIHRTFFTVDGTRIASFSDDKSTAVWDIVSEKQLISFSEHQDYVRAGCVSPVSPDIFLSGGYDNVVNMYDIRLQKKIFSFNHDFPVESLIFLPSGGIFLSAGGNEIKVWDCLTSGKLLAKISQHHKTITSLQLASNGQRILSGSLDKRVKIYDSGTFKVIHTLDYPNPVLSISVSPDDQFIAAGMVDGMISIRQKEDITKKWLHSNKMSYRHEGDNVYCSKVDIYVDERANKIASKHDVCLRKFQYAKALDHVMVNYVANKSPHVTVGLLQELIRRKCLLQALSGRDGKFLVNIIKFTIRHIGNIRYCRVLLHVSQTLLDLCENKVEDFSFSLQATLKLLLKRLREEVKLIVSLLNLQGAIEMILSATETVNSAAADYQQVLTPSERALKNVVLNIS